ncbi:MAG: hypothetical protein M1554_03085 [Patescibacteria group bacterium]|jgi:hypothetical protein|nr:hypothetical protein [Patescibacteria group bacterium]
MTIWWLVLIITVLVVGTIGFLWVAVKLTSILNNQTDINLKKANDSLDRVNGKNVVDVFNNEFREELRNKGRLLFEKIIGDNAMFLQQDLRLTTAQLNDFLKDQISHTLKEEFSKYEQSISDAKQLAIESIQKTLVSLEEQRTELANQIRDEIAKDKDKLIANFEDHMAEILNHYIIEAIGNQVDLSDQLEYIFGDLESNKEAIAEDLRNGI